MFRTSHGVPGKSSARGKATQLPDGASLYNKSMQYEDTAARIEAFDKENDGGVVSYEERGAYHLYLLETEAPIARLKPTGKRDEIRGGYWSHRRRWEDVDDMDGVVLPLDEALGFIANEGIFWTRT